jgi:hypothetical protein
MGTSSSIQRLAVEKMLIAGRVAFFDSLSACGLSFRRRYAPALKSGNPPDQTDTTETGIVRPVNLDERFANNSRSHSRNT